MLYSPVRHFNCSPPQQHSSTSCYSSSNSSSSTHLSNVTSVEPNLLVYTSHRVLHTHRPTKLLPPSVFWWIATCIPHVVFPPERQLHRAKPPVSPCRPTPPPVSQCIWHQARPTLCASDTLPGRLCSRRNFRISRHVRQRACNRKSLLYCCR